MLLLPLPNKLSIAPPITAAAPINDDPINPAAAVVGGLSKLPDDAFINAISVKEAKHDDHYKKMKMKIKIN